jgi:hypothetical protein
MEQEYGNGWAAGMESCSEKSFSEFWKVFESLYP